MVYRCARSCTFDDSNLGLVVGRLFAVYLPELIELIRISHAWQRIFFFGHRKLMSSRIPFRCQTIASTRGLEALSMQQRATPTSVLDNTSNYRPLALNGRRLRSTIFFLFRIPFLLDKYLRMNIKLCERIRPHRTSSERNKKTENIAIKMFRALE